MFLWFIWIYIFIPEKLHSFISRYFLWETTIKIIFSDLKIFLIWWGTETLIYFFDNFKSEYVYIFENLWYTADRPHNIILNFFYHFWIGGFAFIWVLYYKIFNFQNTGWTQGIIPTYFSLILIFIFLLLNPTSIVIYLISTILLAQLFYKDVGKTGMHSLLTSIFLFCITIISIFWAYNSYNFYISETYSYKNNFTKAIEIYKYNPEFHFIKSNFDKWLNISKRKTQQYYFYKINSENNIDSKKDICKDFLENYNYAESYFYCGNSFWDNWKKEIAKIYYKKWLEKLPDLWNKNSKYYDNFLVKYLKIDSHRLTSEKYGLKKILDRLK